MESQSILWSLHIERCVDIRVRGKGSHHFERLKGAVIILTAFLCVCAHVFMSPHKCLEGVQGRLTPTTSQLNMKAISPAPVSVQHGSAVCFTWPVKSPGSSLSGSSAQECWSCLLGPLHLAIRGGKRQGIWDVLKAKAGGSSYLSTHHWLNPNHKGTVLILKAAERCSLTVYSTLPSLFHRQKQGNFKEVGSDQEYLGSTLLSPFTLLHWAFHKGCLLLFKQGRKSPISYSHFDA